MAKTVFQSQMDDSEAFQLLTGKRGKPFAMETVRAGIPEAAAEAAMSHLEAATEEMDSGHFADAMESLRSGNTDLENPDAAEAIVMLTGYPSLLIRKGDFDPPQESIWRERLTPNREAIKRVIASVARVEFKLPGRDQMIGTCWLVDDDVLITNRHVAKVFSELRGGRWQLRPGVDVRADFAEELGSTEALEYLIASIFSIEQAENVDMALMKLGRAAGRQLNLQPVPLDDRLSAVEYLGIVGYPAKDLRNNPRDSFNRYFGDTFEVKRFAPGKVMDANHKPEVFTHNCTTLGGNSGSVVFDVASGNAIGLHFGGNAQVQNYAVKAMAIKQALVARRVRIHAPHGGRAGIGGRGGEGDEARVSADSFRDRNGYQPDFLGEGDLKVALPILSPQQASQTVTTTAGEREIKYRNFSVVMSQPRRLAYLTAVNIDGKDARNPPRVRDFNLDPRIETDLQTGEDMYSHNDFDRGHLVRRLDPCWGTEAASRQANVDSMYFPNIAPQHKDLNQKIWNELEDHILGTVDERDLRASVFTGCIFREGDPIQQRTDIKVPMAFWKVVASISRSRDRRGGGRGPGQLQAQAFVMSQEHLVKPSDLEHIFGKGLETFQITVEELERQTGLDFHKMRLADTFGMTPDESIQAAEESSLEAAGDPAQNRHYKPLRSLADVVM
jgi:endonuclease G, mitochondrial